MNYHLQQRQEDVLTASRVTMLPGTWYNFTSSIPRLTINVDRLARQTLSN